MASFKMLSEPVAAGHVAERTQINAAQQLVGLEVLRDRA